MKRCSGTIWILALSCCAAFATAAVAGVSADEAAAWREDLQFVQTEVPDVHPNAFHTISRQEWDASIDRLIEQLPRLSQHEIVAELAAIVASIGDGHTRLTLPLVEGSGFFAGHSRTPPPADPALQLHYLPIRLALLDDGLFVQEIKRDHAELLGARVERIGNLSADEAMQRMTRLLHHDNDMQIRSLLPSRLVVPELLHAVHIIDDPVRVAFDLSDRGRPVQTLVLSAVPEGDSVDWLDIGSQVARQPLYLQHRDRHFWFEDRPQDNVVFCQYNEVSNEVDETIVAFSERLLAFMTDHPKRSLVLDLRFNRGGDNSLNLAFLHALIRCKPLEEPGHFFVIIGRNTFSAAMMFALDLEKHTQAIFVGEPTGARPNHYGDSRKLTLPRSGLTLRVSTLYWQTGGPKDDRSSLAPQIPVAFLSKDLLAGRDAATERIVALLAAKAPRVPAAQWRGRLLEYDIVVHLQNVDGNWQGSIDFPTEGATGLELQHVLYNEGTLRFEFPNGDSVIAFEGRVRDDTILGSIALDGRTWLWVMMADT